MKILDIPQSGKRGVTVSQGGRYGQVSRALAIPVNPRTPAQAAIRGIFGTISAAWKTLTQAERDAWNAAAATHMTRARLGQSGAMTGLQLFVKINTVNLTYGGGTVDSPPAFPVFPALAPVNLYITNTGGVIAIYLSAPTDPGQATIVRGSIPQSPGVSRTPQVVVLGLCPAVADARCNITDMYTATHGVPPVGTKVFVAVNQFVDGWEDHKVIFQAIVPTAA